jgi:hypothetical protein
MAGDARSRRLLLAVALMAAILWLSDAWAVVEERTSGGVARTDTAPHCPSFPIRVI